MELRSLDIADLRLLVPRVFQDSRGSFTETYNQQRLRDAGIDAVFVQDNQSLSLRRGTVRGLHFQEAPFAQGKLVRVVAGAILDVALDIRRGSPTFGRHVAVTLSAENGAQLWMPEGFAHGYCTLEPNTIVLYKATAFYAPQHDRGIRWNDPALGIDWPVSEAEAILSDKDRVLPMLAEVAPLTSA